MAQEGMLKRSKSLKSILSRRKAAQIDEDEPLPYRYGYMREESGDARALLMSHRPIKANFIQVHITSDDIAVRPEATRPIIPERVASQRNTWPTTPKERKPGSYNFNNTPTLIATPWEHDRSARRPQSRRPCTAPSKPLPRWVFEQLPREIYHCIVRQLLEAYARSTEVDAVGLQTDLKALLLVDKRWHRIAREHLYREIWVPNNHELRKRVFSFQRPRTRLTMLVRALRESEAYAFMVRHLRISAELAAALDASDQASDRKAAYELLLELISLCPNLEYLTGYVPVLQDDLSTKLYIALSKCTKLKSLAWNMRTGTLSGERLHNFTTATWLDIHDSWQHLETLVLCSTEHLEIGPGVLSIVLQRLPSLEHLMLSHLSREDFHNGTLLFLPALRSLRLEHLAGITDQGVEHVAYARMASSLEALSLVGLEVTSLRTIQTLLATLHRLRKFTVVQDTSPEFQPDIEAASTNQGLESPSLEFLHWDVLVAGTATTMIANTIASGRFPSLRKVKVPCDYDGAIQALCRPIARESLDINDLELVERFNTDRYERFLRLAQIQAQLRIRESMQQPSFNVIVEDEDQRVSARHVIGLYLGCMGSKIEYCLDPDVEGSHDALIDFSDVEAPKWLYESRNDMPRSVQGEQMLNLRALF
jgi:hypothetical protein